MTFTYAAYFCLVLATAFSFVHIWKTRRTHPPTTLREWKPRTPFKEGDTIAPLPKHVHMLRVGRSSIMQLHEGVSMRCCMAGCEEPFYMDGETVAWVRDWLNATKADSVKVQAIR